MRIFPKDSFYDNRGQMMTYLFKDPIVEMNHVHSKAGVVRGKHFHKQMNEFLFVISGEMELHYIQNSIEQTVVLGPGEMFLITPGMFHWSIFSVETQYMNFLTTQFDKSNPDLHTT